MVKVGLEDSSLHVDS